MLIEFMVEWYISWETEKWKLKVNNILTVKVQEKNRKNFNGSIKIWDADLQTNVWDVKPTLKEFRNGFKKRKRWVRISLKPKN